MLESELSFLVKETPNLESLGRSEIEQYYLSEGSEPLRIRRIGKRFELTKKLDVAKNDFSRKDEINIPLAEEEFTRLRGLSLRSLVKTRYYFPLPEGLVGEIDAFHGPLEGLIVVEVEFNNESARAAFVPPPWFGRDVSQEEWSANHYLAGKSYQEIKKFLG
jgi:CYTH domain-containing protein